jgi:hypothetical protein
MKKEMIFALIVLFITVSAAPVFAQGGSPKSEKISNKTWAKSEMIKGQIASIDSVKNEITVKQAVTGTDKTVKVDPKEIALLKVGEMVKIKVKPGSDMAQSIKLVVAKKK